MIQNELARSPTLAIPDRLAGSAAVQRRNWWLHVLEGGTLIGSWGAINANTVGTSLVQHLGGAAWMVALMPMATTVGFSLGPIFTAHRLDRQRHFLPVLRSTLPFSRLPILPSTGEIVTAAEAC